MDDATFGHADTLVMTVNFRCMATIGISAALLACGRQQAPEEPRASEQQPVRNSEARAAAPEVAATATAREKPGACFVQGADTLPPQRLRAVGTEPFWGARIEGRCVTYSDPDDQQGTRVWTQYAAQANGATWTGALGGRPFVLRTAQQPGCSDGMSDRRYPLAVKLTVHGEEQAGCAEPL